MAKLTKANYDPDWCVRIDLGMIKRICKAIKTAPEVFGGPIDDPECVAESRRVTEFVRRCVGVVLDAMEDRE